MLGRVFGVLGVLSAMVVLTVSLAKSARIVSKVVAWVSKEVSAFTAFDFALSAALIENKKQPY